MTDIKEHWIGARMEAAGLLSYDQRELLAIKQEALRGQGKLIRFGELAVEIGYCSKEDVENLPDYIGNKLTAAGVLTEDQRHLLLEWQNNLRSKGINIRFGELAIQEGICTDAQIKEICDLYPKS